MPGRFLETEYGGYGMGGICIPILCVVKRISENGVSSNKNFHLHRKRIFFYRKETVYNLYYKYAYKDRYNRTKEEVHKL